jgi:hypothetical protein
MPAEALMRACGKPPPNAAPSMMTVRRLDRKSELGRQVAVDFETDANLDMVMDVEEFHLLKRLPIETRLPTCGD